MSPRKVYMRGGGGVSCLSSASDCAGNRPTCGGDGHATRQSKNVPQRRRRRVLGGDSSRSNDCQGRLGGGRDAGVYLCFFQSSANNGEWGQASDRNAGRRHIQG